MEEKRTGRFEKFFSWMGRHNWEIISGILFFLLLFELNELFSKKDPIYDPFHILEFLFFLIILTLLGVLVNYYIKLNTTLKRTMKVLNFKHNVSLDLLELEEWDTLLNKLIELPNSIAPIHASRMFIYNPISRKTDQIIEWGGNLIENPVFRNNCKKCLDVDGKTNSLMELNCPHLENGSTERGPNEYCLSISFEQNTLALIQFQLEPGEVLSDEQTKIIESIRPEIALALKAGLDSKKLSEMKLAETALAERHSISTYLHDNLSQNLAYLNLKLEQLTSDQKEFSLRQTKNELFSMKGAAQESYKIVRGMLETIHVETTPYLVNLLNEHVKKTSKRNQFNIVIEEHGEQMKVLPEVQRALFYIFQEALSNVAKHAQAKNVNVILDWGCEDLRMTITDDGIGFDSQYEDGEKHFGLTIMKERIDKIHGFIDIDSNENKGTSITVVVPIETIKVSEQL